MRQLTLIVIPSLLVLPVIYVTACIVSLFASCLLYLLKASEHFEDDITYKTWGVSSGGRGQLLYIIIHVEVRGDYNIDIYLQAVMIRE